MPELPEVENVRRKLLPSLLGHSLQSPVVNRPDICDPWPNHLLDGATITSLLRHGKQLALIAHDGRAMCVHLGMTGALEALPATTPPAPHTHVTWQIHPGPNLLTFSDPRRFGGLWFFDSVDALRSTRWNTLGPDALLATPEDLLSACRGSTRAVKAALLDQSVIAGVGNIYADEALFASDVSPKRKAGRVDRSTWGRIVDNLRAILGSSILAGGSTIRDYRGPDGQPGTAQRTHQVYGRAGQPCHRCQTKLSTAQVGQRTTVWCRTCQR